MPVFSASLDKARKVLVLLALALPLPIALSFAVKSVQEDIDDFAELMVRTSKLQSVVAYGNSRKNADALGNHASFFIAPQARSLQIADLQSKLRDLATKSGLQIQSAAEIPKQPDEGELDGIKIHMEMVGPSMALMTFAAATEHAEPWLFLKMLQVQSGDQPGMQTATEPLLAVSADIWSALPPASSEEPKP
jgi:type II secretion system (T2SS) protein M